VTEREVVRADGIVKSGNGDVAVLVRRRRE